MVWLIIGLCVASFIILDIIMFRLVKKKIMRERKRNYFKENFDFIEKDGKIIDYKNKTKTSVYIDDKPMYQHTQVACFNIHNNEPTIIEDDEEVTSDKDNNMVYNYNHWGG